LHELGYTNVRDYRAGIADWVESAETTESVAPKAPQPDPSAAMLAGPPLAVAPDGQVGRVPACLSQMRRRDNSLLALIQRSTLQLFLI
jgi:hypothetical protein